MNDDAKVAAAQEKVLKANEDLAAALRSAKKTDEAATVDRKVEYLKRKLAE